MSRTTGTRDEQLRDRARYLTLKTEDAYSYSRYGYTSWQASAYMLLKRGYSVQEAEAILRSKWTRWAADDRKSRKPTSKDLERFMDGLPNEYEAVRELV